MMKFLKILALFFMSFILVNCDNSKPASNNTDDSKTSQSSENKYSASQGLVITEAKKQLPIEIDELTTLVDIFADNDFVNYKYAVKETPKEALLIPENQQKVLDNLRAVYCLDTPDMKSLKSFFPKGANYIYYIGDEKIFSLQLTPSSCDAK